MSNLGFAAVMGLGFNELLIIFLIVLVIFGSSKLPQLGRGMGEGIRNFRRGLKDPDRGELKDGQKAD